MNIITVFSTHKPFNSEVGREGRVTKILTPKIY
jgi:hypothetical protein